MEFNEEIIENINIFSVCVSLNFSLSSCSQLSSTVLLIFNVILHHFVSLWCPKIKSLQPPWSEILTLFKWDSLICCRSFSLTFISIIQGTISRSWVSEASLVPSLWYWKATATEIMKIFWVSVNYSFNILLDFKSSYLAPNI